MLWIIALCLLMAMQGLCSGAAASAGPCRPEGTSLIVERGDRLALVDPASLAMREIPVDPEAVQLAGQWRQVLDGLSSPIWGVTRTAVERARRIEVVDSRDGSLVFDVSFLRRIELSASAVSPSHQFVIYVQSNNVASEVTILDAKTGISRLVTIAHAADLAAFAIGIVFSPDERCAAVSMERVGGGGAETWLIGLESGSVDRLPFDGSFALLWM